MKVVLASICSLALSIAALGAEADVARARSQEASGDVAAARQTLERASQAGDFASLSAFASFLERRHDPAAAAAWRKALAAGDASQKQVVSRRLAVMELLANNSAAAESQAQAAGWNWKAPAPRTSAASFTEIPGPLRSFARMAALSPDLAAEDLLGALGRNIVTNGYQATSGNEALEQTEYLKLVFRYLSQARELMALSSGKGAILIEQCDSTETGELLKVLGYRIRGACGGEVVLETVNASRAFLTIDSGFPLADLESALRTSKPFNYPYTMTKIPVLYTQEYWLSALQERDDKQSFIEAYLSDPSLCRLYLGMSKIDPDTADQLKTALPATRLRAFAHILDFYGGMMQIRNGAAIVPGGRKAWPAWADLVGTSPETGVQFLERLLNRDDGWLASFFDSLLRINGPTQAFLTEPARLKRYYTAIRGRITSPGPARPVFRANSDMMLLTTRLRMDGATPHIPGGVEVWKNLFLNHPHGKYDGKLTKNAVGWKEPDDLLEALFALSRKAVENEPLKMFMTLSDFNRRRTKPLEVATIDRMLRDFRLMGAQYTVLAEAPELSDAAIIQFLDLSKQLNDIGDVEDKADRVGMFQGLVGLWQILSRHGLIPASGADAAIREIMTPFTTVKNNQQLFDLGRAATLALLKAAGRGGEGVKPQEAMLELLAGARRPSGDDPLQEDSHNQIVQEMARIFEAQRLVSLNTIFELDDNLEAQARGGKMNLATLNRLAARVSEIQPPRNNLTGAEKNSLSFGYYVEKHIENERKTNYRAIVEKAQGDAEKLRNSRGLLAAFLRDTIVGFNYIHYAPPGAQILFTNPVFVRSHDFIGVQTSSNNSSWRPTEVLGTGWPSSAGGRLVGSLSTLPYALAEAEQNFLIPTREQALIWGDLVPQLIISSRVPRFWDVSAQQMHWVALHLRAGEALTAESVMNPEARVLLLEMLDRFASPVRTAKVKRALEDAELPLALENITPAEMFSITALLSRNPTFASHSPAAAELIRLAAADPKNINYPAVSTLFGTPKPTLTSSWKTELLELRTFPTLMGYSSRIMAESWESGNLFYASLADELRMAPAQLNVTVPQWTRTTVEKIFATHLEDWPALLRSLRLTGEEVRSTMRKAKRGQETAALNE
jgi:hypothetical protein